MTRARGRRPCPDSDSESEEPPPCAPLKQKALKGEVHPYVMPDHTLGESFPGRQPPTTQLSLFETGFKRKSGQRSLFETGFVRKRRKEFVEHL